MSTSPVRLLYSRGGGSVAAWCDVASWAGTCVASTQQTWQAGGPPLPFGFSRSAVSRLKTTHFISLWLPQSPKANIEHYPVGRGSPCSVTLRKTERLWEGKPEMLKATQGDEVWMGSSDLCGCCSLLTALGIAYILQKALWARTLRDPVLGCARGCDAMGVLLLSSPGQVRLRLGAFLGR